MKNSIKGHYQKIKKDLKHVADNLIDFLKWFYYEALSWKMIEWYKIDDINKKILRGVFCAIISIIGLPVVLITFFVSIFWLKNSIFAISIICIVSIWIFFLVLYIPRRRRLDLELYVKSCQSIFQYPENLSDLDHSAIIYLHYDKAEVDEGISDCISLLIDGFRKNNVPYKVYHFFNPGDFEPVYYNPHVTDLWILGHGDRGGFSYGKKRRDIDYFRYSSLKKIAPKKFIAQLHCNGGEGESLIAINKPENGFISEYMQILPQIRFYIIIKMKELNNKIPKN
jgi:hypothetical protein